MIFFSCGPYIVIWSIVNRIHRINRSVDGCNPEVQYFLGMHPRAYCIMLCRYPCFPFGSRRSVLLGAASFPTVLRCVVPSKSCIFRHWSYHSGALSEPFPGQQHDFTTQNKIKTYGPQHWEYVHRNDNGTLIEIKSERNI